MVTALRTMTTSESHPLVHHWYSHPESKYWPARDIADVHFAICESLRPAIRAVIQDHVDFASPVLMEGDYLLPELAAEFDDRVRAVVLIERDAQRLTANFAEREPSGGRQEHRAAASVLVGELLAERATRHGIPLVPAWPWATGPERLLRALDDPGHAGVDDPGDARREDPSC